MQYIFIGDVHGCIQGKGAVTTPFSLTAGHGDQPCSDEQALDSASAWSLLRDTFEYRDFDDSLVFAE